MWIYDWQMRILFDISSLTRGQHCIGLGGLGIFYDYAHSPQCDTAAALVEFALYECSCL